LIVRRRIAALVVPAALLVLLALVPRISLDVPHLFTGPINLPGTLQLLALWLVFGGVAMS
jgi:branched-chain amino acid transport system permease protein